MRFFQRVSEMVTGFAGGLRWPWRGLAGSWWSKNPVADKTTVSYDLCRQLYRNDGADSDLGAGFCKPIIDRAVEFMGLPIPSSENEETDTFLNECVQTYWAAQLTEAFRNSMRDSKTIVRVWQPYLSDKLTTNAEREHCSLMLYEPERVTIIRDPRNPKRIQQAIIVTQVEFVDEVQPNVDPQRGSEPQVKEHEIWEIISPESYRYYDKTDAEWLTDWGRDNPDGFVPLLEMWNEYDSALSGGQSDLESVYPFVKAFHEVLRQVLQAHKYHSIPKLKFQVRDIRSFLTANFPSTLDEFGQPIPGAAIPWHGREVLIMGDEDDLGFVEMESVLGDSKVLLEFLIDCISIASETPEWAFMRVEAGSSEGAMNAETIPYEKRTERKRTNFAPYLQELFKMALSMNGRPVERVEVLWPVIRVDSLVTMSQAVQELVMSLELLLDRKLMSDDTARETLKSFPLMRRMKAPAQEARDAERNYQPILEAPALPGEPSRNGKPRVPAVSGRNGGGANE